ncbi:Ig-like domain-containing protein [Flavobacterium johnsoniae]|uniref:Ig-like domain-containing protein n=1 Tax=Flavobacterium johnsoniae TaxID=986 RepID=UPI00091B9C59|nr:Ig-like domain-containing protein [Flavobacterium johnsoniae]SHL35009.1 gliding motility-associated C-terminal domain-containing protein [Flavobacterium johnsoniae]
MIKNYFNFNSVFNVKKAILLFFVFFTFSQVSNAQCAIPVQGCSGTNLSNFGADSNNDASSIEYDNFISSFHSTIVRTSDGSLQVWGEKVANDGTNVVSPLTINKANFAGLNSGVTVLKAALGSNSTNGTQGIVLATDGLYAWGTRGAVLAASITTNATFQKVTIASNASGLPTGVSPSDVKMMFATFNTLAITTCSGDVWVISQTASVRGNGAAGDALNWYRVTTSETGNPFLTNVVVCRGSYNGLMALKSDGTVYVWGNNVYLGDNNPSEASQTRAARMTLPASITPKMIGSTCNRDNQRSYYILATNNNLYSLGANASKQLGDWYTTERQSWVQPRYTSRTGQVMNNIKWISVQEHDTEYGAVNVITTDYNLYAFGQNDNRLLGRGSSGSVDPLMPDGVSASDKILAVETGGHTSMIVKACESRFGYVGHRINGSMGSGPTTTTGTENSYNFTTANVQICGAESNPVIQPISLGGGPDSKYCIDDPVLLNPTPAGGTLELISGPATLNTSTNTLRFTGEGTVQVRYTVTTSCGGTTVTNRSFEGVLCPADLQISKTADNSNPSVGNNVVFTITAKNNGPYKATGVTINDALPSGYTFVSAVPSTGTWSAPNWTVGSLTNGSSATLAVTATVKATGSYANTASISGNNPDSTTGNNSATATPLVQTNLSVTKTVNNTTPNVGDQVTFTITASNAGPSGATGVTVTDNLPSGYTFVSATPSTGTWSAPDWTIGDLANGASATLSMTARVNATGSYANTASISGSQNDPTPGNNSGSATPTVNHNPTAVLDTYTVAEDNTVTLTPLSNDSDVDGNTISIVSINGTALTGSAQVITVPNGTVNISAAGVITFTPSADFNSTTPISFPYVITDGNLTATANIEITVTAVNDAPVAVKDEYTVAEDNTVTLTPLVNDTDVEGDTLSIVSINGTTLTGSAQVITVPNGIVNISASGVITFTPSANFNSTTPISFPYVITDGSLTATANIEITVTAVNDAPVAVKDEYTVAEDNTVTLTPLVNDTDVEGDTLSIVSINGTALTGSAQVITVPNGTVNISAAGVITFTPSADFNSTTPISFPYVITDGNLTATANIEITVTAVNDAPVAVKDEYTVAEDNTVTLTPLVNDTDVDGDTLTISSINGTTLTGSTQVITVLNGTVNISAAGVITFTPLANFNSTTPISFPYVITDGNLTATANIEITVTAVNDAPVAVKDEYTVDEDNTVTLTPLVNDTDVEGDTLSIVSINGTALTGSAQVITVPNGTVNISAVGVITFMPSADFNSTTPISFPYVITDGNLTATANIEITVTAVNDAPVAVKDEYTVAEDNTVTLTPLINDTDVDGDILTISSINGTTLTGSAQVITVPNGTVNISASGVITFTPSADFNSTTPISFPYVITDGNLTATANIEITVTAVNDAPVAVKDEYTVNEGATLNVPAATGVLSNDTDVEGDALTAILVTGPSHGTLILNADGSFTYIHDGSETITDSFTYKANDGNLDSNVVTVEITVNPVNDAPVAVKDEYTVAEDNTVTLNPLNNDTDAEGDTLSIVSINGTALTGSAQIITVPNGTVNISASGVITFTPSADFNSTTPISFPYVITDGNLTATANIEITVTAVNDAPVAVKDEYTINEGATLNVPAATGVLSNDTDVEGDALTAILVTGPSHGTLILNADGSFTYIHDGSETITDSFTYKANDGNLDSNIVTVEITVNPVNDAPVAVKDEYTVAEDNTVTLTPLANDTDVEGDTLSIVSINGTVLTGSAQVITVPNGTVNISASRVITFTPSADFNSTTPISFPYVITDGNLTATANIEITVTAVNDAPVAVKDEYTVAEDNTVTLTPLVNDTDVEGDTLSIVSINGTSLTGSAQVITVPNGTVNISAAGVITFTPSADFNSTTPISFPYVITDGSLTATANIEITVTAVNDAPVAVKDEYTVAEDNTVTLTPLVNDTDVEGDTLSIVSINGTSLTGSAQVITVPNGTVNISAAGVITFTPSVDFNSTTPISFPYVITDGSLTATANIEITVTAVNDAPVAVKDEYTVAEDNTVTLTPLVNDTDVEGDTLSIVSINGTALTGGVQSITVPNGTVNISAAGVITFTPSADFNSTTPISFPYIITDGSLTATANIEITVTAVNDAPVALKDEYTVDEGATLNVPALTGVLSNDSDVEGDALTAILVTGPSHGTLTLNADGSFTYVHDGSETTTDSFTYKANDGNLDSNTVTVKITVNPVNDAPVANSDTNNVIASTAGPTTINALTATGVDGTIANYTILSLPANGALSLAGNPIVLSQILTPAEAAMITYTPSGTFTGNVTFTFTATDNLGLSAVTPATITIPVGNNAPVAHDDTNSHIPSRAGATAIKALTATDTDGTIVNYIVVTLPSHGVLALSGVPVTANQTLTPAQAAMLTYDPSGAFSGNDTFTFTATDNNGAVDATPATITIPVDKTVLVATPDPVGTVVGINETVEVVNVLDNDTLNNDPLLLTDVKLDVLVPDPNNVLTLKPDGTVELIPNAPPGNYTLTYEICEKANSSNCTSASVTVTVEAPKMTVTASSYCSDNAPYVQYNVKADNFTPKGLITITWIDSANNVVATQTNMPLSSTVLWPGTVLDSNNKPIDWPGWIFVNGQWIEGNDGFQLTRPAVTMQFSLNPTESITVNYPAAVSGCNARPHFGIEAENDDDNIIADGLNGSPEVINVLDNDKLNGVPVNSADVILTPRDFPTGITLNSDGTIDVAPGTKGGSHTLTYQICEKANPENCTDAIVKIFVEVPSITVVMKVELNDHNKNDNAEAGETLTYTFTITNNGNVPLHNITISDLLPGVVITGGPISLGVGESDSHTFTGTYTLTQADINAGTVVNQATVTGTTQSGIKVEDKSDAANENGDAPTEIDVNGCKIKIFNAISLNGDNMNERFYIRGIECYPDNTVQIFNRWGVLVFERDHYNNNDIVFKGFSEGRTTVKESNGLPEGTYYYIVRYKDNNSNPKQEAGYLYLIK